MSAKKKILILEDEKTMAKALKLKLDNSGFSAKIVFNGEEALNILLKEKFDLILLDLITPRKDGFAVLEELKKRGDSTKVIISSNLSQLEDIEKAKKLGAKDYFIKSNTSINKVIEHVNNVLEK